MTSISQALAKLQARANQPKSSSGVEVDTRRLTGVTGTSSPTLSGGGQTGCRVTHQSGSNAPPAAFLRWQEPYKTGHGTAKQFDKRGKYRIDAVQTLHSLDFTVWALGGASGGLNERLGCVGDGPAARALCERHAGEARLLSKLDSMKL